MIPKRNVNLLRIEDVHLITAGYGNAGHLGEDVADQVF
jgi:hypothetical protein